MKKSEISFNKKSKPVLSKTWAWIILVCLVVLDASLDLIFAGGKGLESPIWKPIANLLGLTNPLFLTPLVLLLFFIMVKIVAFIEEKIEKVSKAEELILTTLVLVYGVFNFWLILVYFLDFNLFKNQYYLIPVLIIIGIAYSWWAEKKLKDY